MDYKRGDMVYFQFHPEYYEDETWYPGTILRHSDVSKCYEITVKGQWRHFFAPPERLKIREENVDEVVVWERLGEASHYCGVRKPTGSN